jgi:hypothetical protein
MKLLLNTLFNVIIDKSHEKNTSTPKANLAYQGKNQPFTMDSRSKKLVPFSL